MTFEIGELLKSRSVDDLKAFAAPPVGRLNCRAGRSYAPGKGWKGRVHEQAAHAGNRRLRPRRGRDAGLSPRRRGRAPWRSAIAARSASAPTAASTRRSSRPMGAAASTSSRACSAPRSWRISRPTSRTSSSALPVDQGRAGRCAGPTGARRRQPGAQPVWARPLGDPVGGTKAANGRHPVKMFEPKAPEGAPKEIVYLDPRLAAVLRRRAAGLWPSRTCWRSPRR